MNSVLPRLLEKRTGLLALEDSPRQSLNNPVYLNRRKRHVSVWNRKLSDANISEPWKGEKPARDLDVTTRAGWSLLRCALLGPPLQPTACVADRLQAETWSSGPSKGTFCPQLCSPAWLKSLSQAQVPVTGHAQWRADGFPLPSSLVAFYCFSYLDIRSSP